MPVRGETDSRPPRPSLPPLLVAGLVLWATTALLWPPLRLVPAQILPVAGTTALGLATLLAPRILRGVRAGGVPLGVLAALAVLASVVLCAFWGGALRGSMALADAEGRSLDSAAWRVELTEDARRGDFGWHAEARLSCEDGRTLRARLNLPEDAALLQGQSLTVAGALRPPSETAAEYYWGAGLAASLTVSGSDFPSEERSLDSTPFVSLRQRALDLIDAHGGGNALLLQALVCGWRPAIGESGLYDCFKAVGLAHLVAVSGAHLSIVSLFVAGGLRLLRCGRRATALTSALFLIGYVAFTGMPVSALRAAIMAATGLFSLWTDRRNSALSALGLCLLLFVGIDPSAALSVSLALSAGSTLGIVLFAPLLSSAFAGHPRLKRVVGDPIALTGASALATQPYAAALFSQLPLLSPLANLVASPLFALACLVGFVAVLAACLVPVAAPWLIGVASTACAPLSLVVDALASLSGTCLPIDAVPLAAAALSCGLCLALWAWWPRVSIRSLTAAVTGAALILGLLRFPFGMAPDAIVMLDVGQGDAFIVRSGENVLLIDTGNQDALLKAALARQRVGRLDAVAVTHSDDDHCGSLPVLGDVAPAAALLVPEGLPACGCRACAELMEAAEAEGLVDDLVELSLGDTVRCGRFSLTVLWPERLADDGGNADSLCLLAFWDGDGDGAAEWTALFTGDAEAEQLGQLSDRLPAGGVDVLKVGHHGSKKSLDASLAERLSPAVALIGVGEHNRYGHPSREVLDLLDASGCATYCSDEAGDVVVAFSEDTLTVSAQRQG